MIATDLYRYYDADDRLLYIGVSKCAVARAMKHQYDAAWWASFAYMTREVYPTRAAALRAEKAAIKAERPIHNIVHGRPTESTRDYIRRRWPDMPPVDEHTLAAAAALLATAPVRGAA